MKTMKKYAIILVSLLLFFLILNTAVASDENITSTLEANDEINLNEEAPISYDNNFEKLEKVDDSECKAVNCINSTDDKNSPIDLKSNEELLAESSNRADPDFKIKIWDRGYSYSMSSGMRSHNIQLSIISENVVSKNVKVTVYEDNKKIQSLDYDGERVNARMAFSIIGGDVNKFNNKIVNYTILLDFNGDSKFLEVHLNKSFLLNNDVIQIIEDENFFEDDGTDDEYYRFTHPYHPTHTPTPSNNTDDEPKDQFDDDYDDPIPINPNFQINITDVEKGNPTIIKVNADSNFTNSIDLKINDVSIPINIMNGAGNASITLDVGDYTASIDFNGNDYYLKSHVTKTFKVKKPKLDSAISITNESDIIRISLSANNQPIKYALVNYTINSINYSNTTDENGEIKISGLTGTVEIRVSYMGNESYNPQSANSSFVFKAKSDETTNATNQTVEKVKTSITSSDISVVYNTAKNLVLTLKNERNEALAHKDVTVTINNVPYKTTTNEKGQASLALPTNLSPKTYTATISFKGDETYKASELKTNIAVKKATPKLTAKAKTFKVKVKTKKYTVTLKNNKNIALKNTKVTLKVNGKTYSAKTNSKGQATFKITKLTKKATFKATIKYAGNGYYTSISKTAKIKITK